MSAGSHCADCHRSMQGVAGIAVTEDGVTVCLCSRCLGFHDGPEMARVALVRLAKRIATRERVIARAEGRAP